MQNYSTTNKIIFWVLWALVGLLTLVFGYCIWVSFLFYPVLALIFLAGMAILIVSLVWTFKKFHSQSFLISELLAKLAGVIIVVPLLTWLGCMGMLHLISMDYNSAPYTEPSVQ